MSTAEQVVENLLGGDSEELDPKRIVTGMEQRNPNYAFITLADLDLFTQSYLEAAFFTDEERLKEEAEEFGLDPNTHDLDWSVDALQQAKKDCDAFRTDRTVELLDEAGAKDDQQNGHDFWYTRNHHGVGFWDRNYEEEYGRALTKIAHSFREASTYLGGDGEIYFG
jgi:hypothetical protein